MYCPQCGTEVADDRSACPACGAAVDGGTDDSAGTASEPTDGQPGGVQAGGEPADQPADDATSGGQPAGGRPGGQPTGGPTSGQPGGGQSGQPAGGQPEGQAAGGQPNGGRGGQPAGGQGGVGATPSGSGRRRTGGGTAAAGGGLGGALGFSVRDLPLMGGLVAGVLVYIVGFVVTALVAFAVLAPQPGPVDLSLSQVAELFYNAHFTTLGGGDPDVSRLPATFGAAFVILPWFLFVAGSRFGRWQSDDGIELNEQLVAGTTVVVGYLPAVALGSMFLPRGGDLFPPDFAVVLLFAGLLYPLVCGALGSVVSAFFGEFGGLRARTTGVLLGVASLVLTYGVTYVSVDSAVQSEPVGLALVSGVTYIAGHLFAIDGDGGWFMLMLLPLVIVAATGYLRARRANATTWRDGLRAGGSFAFGYSAGAFLALLLAAITVDFAPSLASEVDIDTVTALAAASEQVTLEVGLTPPQFLEWFFVIGVCYPLVVGSLAGASHVLIRRTVTGNASETPT